MPKLRSILSLVLVLVTTLLVSCGSPTVTTPPTYTPEKIAQIQILYTPVAEARERMVELGDLIDDENWVDTRTFIHGPLGGLRQQIRYLNESLLVKDQKQAKTLAKDLFADFERIDAAAQTNSYSRASGEYGEAIRHFDNYLDLIPQG